jgi:hypothetical protein
MPQFYFHFQTGTRIARDQDGIELPSASVATEEAKSTAREMVAEAVKFGSQDVPDCIIVANDAGREVAKIGLAEVVPVRLCK